MSQKSNRAFNAIMLKWKSDVERQEKIEAKKMAEEKRHCYDEENQRIN